MARVRSLVTGREHDVPAGHPSLSSRDFEVLWEGDEAPKPAKQEKAPAKSEGDAKPKASSKRKGSK